MVENIEGRKIKNYIVIDDWKVMIKIQDGIEGFVDEFNDLLNELVDNLDGIDELVFKNKMFDISIKDFAKMVSVCEVLKKMQNIYIFSYIGGEPLYDFEGINLIRFLQSKKIKFEILDNTDSNHTPKIDKLKKTYKVIDDD